MKRITPKRTQGEKREQTRREEENEWSAGETVWVAFFPVRCYGNLQSWSVAQERSQCSRMFDKIETKLVKVLKT